MAYASYANGAGVTFENVTVAFGGHTVLESISAEVPKGSCTAIVGPNGAGKTTMLLALLGEVPYTGCIRISRADEGRDLRMGYVPQRLQFDRGMPLTVLEFMVMGWQRTPLWFGIRRAFRDRAGELLGSVKMNGLEKRSIGALSGGEMQRVLLALALGREPDILVLDEAASGVDFEGEKVFWELLDKLRYERGFTQLVVSHDLPTVNRHATHVICLNRKVGAEGLPREVLTGKTLGGIFGLRTGEMDGTALPEGSPGCSSASWCGVSDRA